MKFITIYYGFLYYVNFDYVWAKNRRFLSKVLYIDIYGVICKHSYIPYSCVVNKHIYCVLIQPYGLYNVELEYLTEFSSKIVDFINFFFLFFTMLKNRYARDLLICFLMFSITWPKTHKIFLEFVYCMILYYNIKCYFILKHCYRLYDKF